MKSSQVIMANDGDPFPASTVFIINVANITAGQKGALLKAVAFEDTNPSQGDE